MSWDEDRFRLVRSIWERLLRWPRLDWDAFFLRLVDDDDEGGRSRDASLTSDDDDVARR